MLTAWVEICFAPPLRRVSRNHFAGKAVGLRPEVRTALAALGPPPGVERVALGTREIHRARKKLSDDSAETQNAHYQGDVQQRLVHGS